MKSIKTTFTALLLTIIMTPWVSCKKESVTKLKTTQEKLLGKWNWVSEVVNDYYGGMQHVTTYTFPPGDYLEFKNDGTATQSHSGSTLTYGYGIIDESNIWMVITGNIYSVKILTESDLQLYKKDVSGADYNESTLNFNR